MRATGVPVVLIHGVGLDHTMWDAVVKSLPHRRTITYDLIGHGRAAAPAGPYTLQTFVDQLTGIVDSLDTEIDLVGFSMGAMIAEGYALSHGGTNDSEDGAVERRARSHRAERQAIVDRVAEVRAGRFGVDGRARIAPLVHARLRSCASRRRRRRATTTARQRRPRRTPMRTRCSPPPTRSWRTRSGQRSSTPTLVATGGDDQRSTPAMTEALAALLPNGQSVILAGLRHLTPLESPTEVANLIDTFTGRSPNYGATSCASPRSRPTRTSSDTATAPM